MRLKVQHNNRELGPFSPSELRLATDTGTVCMMDWCWNHDDFDGVMTVYQVLCEGRLSASGTSMPLAREEIRGRRNGTRSGVQAPAAEGPPARKGDTEADLAARAELDDRRRRLEQELLNSRMKLADEQRQLAAEKDAFYQDRSRLEADLVHMREDLARAREALGEERKRLADQYKRHSRNVAAFDTLRRKTLTDLGEERQRLKDEWHRVLDSERRLQREREEWDAARQAWSTQSQEERRQAAEEQRRFLETARRMNAEKAELEERWQSTNEKAEADRKRFEEERARLTEQERRLQSDRQEFEKYRRRVGAEFDQERRRLEDERRLLNHGRRETAPAHGRPREEPRDERYYGRLLGLQGRVSFEEIKRAYRFAATRCHPDKLQDMHPELVASATAMFRELNEALEFFKARCERK
ncbi:chaperone protein DnaJ [mine drainage metagenome]|uniref:Chaperone protein DnaJ n=1 Tax=mine drainage metagenome TaxID=410659 RepID=A0A1J5TFF4_9ZZZZ